MRLGLYAGTFDPITRGHEDLIRRSLEFVDHLVVAVAINPDKNPLFGPEERTRFIREIFAGEPRIEVRSFTGLLVDLARELRATMFIRGLRAVSDFEYEFQMALMNRHLAPEIETVFLVPSLETSYISSSLVRQVARFRGTVDDLVHPVVAGALLQKFRA
ncbi:MAG: pantetheine-phosphate adenylyltransferase [Gemmatimonadota bacterium]|jgi:pantetheine-phosphate adenylyltransferase|nr:pantetheine-phosphate adenylyltransferase [Gemmatimonadota bacterium]